MTLAEMRVVENGEAWAYRNLFPFERFLDAVLCPVCRCHRSGNADVPNWQAEDGCDGCRCHEED